MKQEVLGPPKVLQPLLRKMKRRFAKLLEKELKRRTKIDPEGVR